METTGDNVHITNSMFAIGHYAYSDGSTKCFNYEDIKDMRSHISQIKATSLSVVEAKGIAKIFVTMFDETLQKTVERILYQK